MKKIDKGRAQKKVLHIFRRFLPFTETFIRNQVSHHINYTPYILYAEDMKGEMAYEVRSNIQTRKAVNGRLGSLFYNKLRQLSVCDRKDAVQFIQHLEPDIIHVHFGVDMLTFSKVLDKCDIPVVVSFYGYDCTSFPKKFYGIGKLLLQRKVFKHKNIKAVFAMSPDMEKDLLAIGCPKKLIHVHYYGSECSRFRMERDYDEGDTIRFMIISSLVGKKGHLILLEAWKLLIGATDKEFSLTIIGSGKMKRTIMSFIEENKLANVFLYDAIQYGSLEHFKALNSTDIFVHPSIITADGDKEGIPGVIIEAMASGLPVISTFHAGIPSIIENGNTGLLVEERNAQQLAEAMARLTSDSVLRESIGRNASQYVINNLDIAVKEMELEDLYDGIVFS